MKMYLNINRHVIQRNNRVGTTDPPIRVTRGKYGRPRYYHTFRLPAKARVVYDARHPLPCGAKVWMEWDSGA